MEFEAKLNPHNREAELYLAVSTLADFGITPYEGNFSLIQQQRQKFIEQSQSNTEIVFIEGTALIFANKDLSAKMINEIHAMDINRYVRTFDAWLYKKVLISFDYFDWRCKFPDLITPSRYQIEKTAFLHVIQGYSPKMNQQEEHELVLKSVTHAVTEQFISENFAPEDLFTYH